MVAGAYIAVRDEVFQADESVAGADVAAARPGCAFHGDAQWREYSRLMILGPRADTEITDLVIWCHIRGRARRRCAKIAVFS